MGSLTTMLLLGCAAIIRVAGLVVTTVLIVGIAGIAVIVGKAGIAATVADTVGIAAVTVGVV